MKRDIMRDLDRFEGLAQRSQLFALGASRRELTALVGSGILRVPRRGWMSSGTAPHEAVRAIELRGVLGGSSALRSYGIWVDGTELVISTAPTGSRLPSLRPGEHRVWMGERFPNVSAKRWRVSVIDAFLQHALTAERPSLIASIDSGLEKRVLSAAAIDALMRALPERLRSIRRQLDPRSMSGTESKLRVACVAAGLRVEPQASVDRVGFVDLLVDDWLIVEVDSREFHEPAKQQHVDRVRDGNAVLGGYGHLRFDYHQVQFELGWCIRVILARLESGQPSVRSTG